MENYSVICPIGKGNFGCISKILRKSDQKVLVWKELDYGRMSEKEKQQIVSEVNILRELKHPNIVRYYDRIIDKQNSKIFIIMEHCSGGDWGQQIKRCKKNKEYIAEDILWKIFTQLVLAWHGCHNHKNGKILHRDIKPSNVFLDSENNVKLGDFGLSRVWSNESNFAYSHVGTPYYMSPEQIDEMRYNDKSDIWSLGCFWYEWTTFNPPFEAKNHVMLANRIKSGKVEKINIKYSEELARIISWMLKVSPDERPSIEDLLNTPQVSLRLREKRVKEMMSKMKVLEDELKAKEEEIKKKEQEILIKENTIKSEYDNISMKLKEIQERENAVLSREENIKEKEEIIAEKERTWNSEIALITNSKRMGSVSTNYTSSGANNNWTSQSNTPNVNTANLGVSNNNNYNYNNSSYFPVSSASTQNNHLRNSNNNATTNEINSLISYNNNCIHNISGNSSGDKRENNSSLVNTITNSCNYWQKYNINSDCNNEDYDMMTDIKTNEYMNIINNSNNTNTPTQTSTSLTTTRINKNIFDDTKYQYHKNSNIENNSWRKSPHQYKSNTNRIISESHTQPINPPRSNSKNKLRKNNNNDLVYNNVQSNHKQTKTTFDFDPDWYNEEETCSPNVNINYKTNISTNRSTNITKATANYGRSKNQNGSWTWAHNNSNSSLISKKNVKRSSTPKMSSINTNRSYNNTITPTNVWNGYSNGSGVNLNTINHSTTVTSTNYNTPLRNNYYYSREDNNSNNAINSNFAYNHTKISHASTYLPSTNTSINSVIDRNRVGTGRKKMKIPLK